MNKGTIKCWRVLVSSLHITFNTITLFLVKQERFLTFKHSLYEFNYITFLSKILAYESILKESQGKS